MQSPGTILFDLDGTLIDSIDLIVDSYHHTFRTHGLPITPREEIIEGIGTPLVAVFSRFTTDRDTITTWIATYRQYNLTHHDTRVRAFPGVVEMVSRLSSEGRRLGLVTSKNNAGARRGLSRIGLHDAFPVVIGADDVTNHKPHREPVDKALHLLGSDPADAVFIGDSHHDVASGRAAGVRTLAVSWGPMSRDRLALAMPDWICDSADDVLTTLGLAAPKVA